MTVLQVCVGVSVVAVVVGLFVFVLDVNDGLRNLLLQDVGNNRSGIERFLVVVEVAEVAVEKVCSNVGKWNVVIPMKLTHQLILAMRPRAQQLRGGTKSSIGRE